MEREQKDIEIKSNTQESHLEVALTVDGIEYLQEILNDLKNSEAGRHWHIDDFEGWLGGDFKYLVIVRSE